MRAFQQAPFPLPGIHGFLQFPRLYATL